MKRYINDDYKVKNNIRKAVCISQEELESKIRERATFVTSIKGVDLRVCCVILQEDDSVIQKDMTYDVDSENLEIIGFKKLKNGLVYLETEQAGDWELPVRVIYYFDGVDVRCYVPTKGNLVNVYCNTAFGSEQNSSENDIIILNKYKQDKYLQDFVDGYEDIEDIDLCGLYLEKYGLNDYIAEINEDGIKEDITKSIEVLGK